jgi:hypothetical protein
MGPETTGEDTGGVMTLAEALAAAHEQYNRETAGFVLDEGSARSVEQFVYERAMEKEFDAIADSVTFEAIVASAIKSIPGRGVMAAIEQAAVMSLRFGMRTQRILQGETERSTKN